MAKFQIGDLVVLKSGSMRMCVEAQDESADTVSTVWCNEGIIGRDTFALALLNKWEYREDSRPAPRPVGGDRDGGKTPYRGGGDRDGGKPPHRGGGDRDGGGKPPYRGGPDKGGDGGSWGNDKSKKQGWDGKPRDKKYYRSDD